MITKELLTNIGALLLGLVLRILIPYVLEGIQIVSDSGNIKDWPKFHPKYPLSILAAAIPYALALLMVEGVAEWLLTLTFRAAVVFSYGGGDLSRRISKLFIVRLR